MTNSDWFRRFLSLIALWIGLALSGCGGAYHATTQPDASANTNATVAAPQALAEYIKQNFAKREELIAMRDGVKLFTSIYMPRDEAKTYPIMLLRTPYSVAPYDPDEYKEKIGPSDEMARAGYIFVYQDVRGKYLSEGEFVNVRPHLERKQSPSDIDESTDTFDTIDWLVKNVPNHNGRVGMWGISYPGFYAAAGMIDAHPALKAVSPQAPIADWYYDDFHHHGAFFLPHSFNFLNGFGRARPEPTTQGGRGIEHSTPDGYQFFLDLGALPNANERYFHHEVAFWDEMAAHPNWDEFWQARNILPRLRNVAPAVMTVGGWFDAEDLYGPLKIYRSVEEKNPAVFNMLVMGPWVHGGWARTDGDRIGNIIFGDKHSHFYRPQIEQKFFDHFLKDEGGLDLPEAYVFETGANRWRTFARWPPVETETKPLYLHADRSAGFEPPDDSQAFDEFVSDPAKPVPFTEDIAIGMTKEYMTDDQRFAARRPDVLSYQTPPLGSDLTVAGPIQANLWVSTTEADADWIVKVIDVFPNDAPDHSGLARGRRMGGYQMMVRSEVIRGRFRNSYERPEPFTPNEPTLVDVELQDVLHTFKPGHRLMVQIQSTWFPLVDRNPQKWVDNIFEARDEDFVKATHRVYCEAAHPTHLVVGVLPDE